MAFNRGMTLLAIRRFVTQSVVAGLAVMGMPAYAQATQPVPEYRLKAAFVYNFALFTEWPGSVLAEGAPLQLCFTAHSALRPEFMKMAGKSIRGHQLEVSALTGFESVRRCHVLFIDGVDREHWSLLRRHLDGASVLTVSDDADIGRPGAMVTLFVDNNRIAFDIDMNTARQAQLTISSKLLRLARNMQ